MKNQKTLYSNFVVVLNRWIPATAQRKRKFLKKRSLFNIPKRKENNNWPSGYKSNVREYYVNDNHDWEKTEKAKPARHTKSNFNLEIENVPSEEKTTSKQ